MQAANVNDQQFEFVKHLARDLANGDIQLPSFPAVVIKIRDLLEDEKCDMAQISQVVSADAVLASRLLVFANSAYHNPSGEAVASLEAAITKLGLKLVRNTALSLAIKQLLLANKEPQSVAHVRSIWTGSMHLAAMSHAIAAQTEVVDAEGAFMCGLLHQIGKLYILTKAKDFPQFLGDAASLQEVQEKWYQQVGRSIVEMWGFPEEVWQSMDPDTFFDEHTHLKSAPVDVVLAARNFLQTKVSNQPYVIEDAVCRKLKLREDDVPAIESAYREKLASVQQSLS